MIENFEYIDKKPDGTKERQLGAIVELYNKLSADEANLIRAKFNEIIQAVNASKIPLYSQFALKFKGEGNIDLSTIEVGDVAHRYSTVDGVFENAIYNGGGDPQNVANYTVVLPGFDPETFISDGLTNEFTLTQAFKASSLYIDRGVRYFGTEWDQSDNVVEVLGAILPAGKKIYIIP